jgi:hypothetical protein
MMTRIFWTSLCLGGKERMRVEKKARRDERREWKRREGIVCSAQE